MDYPSPSWIRSTLFNDNLTKWVKAKVCVHADSVLSAGEIEQNPGVADEKWTGQVEDLKRFPSYQDAVGFDGEAIEFEWKKFPGFTTLTILKEIQMDLERKNIEPETLKIGSSLCQCSTTLRIASRMQRKVKNFSKRFLPGHWTFLGLGLEKKWYGSSYDGQWDRTANKMVQQFKETGRPIFTATSALSRASLKRKRGKSTIHYNGYFMNTELSSPAINSLNQVSIYAAVTNWCYKFALEEEKEHIPTLVDHRILAIVEPEEVEMLTSSPNLAQGNLMMRSEAKFKVLEKKGHMTQLCEKPYSKILSQQEIATKFDQMVKTDGDKSHFYAENMFVLESFHKPKKLGAFPAGTVIGPIWGSYCEHSWRIWIGSCDSINMQTWRRDLRCDIQETERFVNETHTHEAENRSSWEWLENLQECRESMSYWQREVPTSPKETSGSFQHRRNWCRLSQSCSK